MPALQLHHQQWRVGKLENVSFRFEHKKSLQENKPLVLQWAYKKRTELKPLYEIHFLKS